MCHARCLTHVCHGTRDTTVPRDSVTVLETVLCLEYCDSDALFMCVTVPETLLCLGTVTVLETVLCLEYCDSDALFMCVTCNVTLLSPVL